MKICRICQKEKPLSDFRKCGKYTRNECRPCANELGRQWRESKGPAMLEYYKENDLKRDREKRKQWRSEWLNNNREAVNAKRREWWNRNRERVNAKLTSIRQNDPQVKLNNAISSGMKESLHFGKNRRRWQELVGYTLEDLRKHLEKQFKDGMSWDNYGKYGWHVDHIIPLSAFHYETPNDIDFKQCWALKNLRPMWAAENISKHGKVDKPFQPSLAIAI